MVESNPIIILTFLPLNCIQYSAKVDKTQPVFPLLCLTRQLPSKVFTRVMTMMHY